MEFPDAVTLTKVWQKVMKDSGRPWVLFRRGTCVMLDTETQDLRGVAKQLMREWGPVRIATPSADFNVLKLADDSGWLVACHHPSISTYVGPSEVPSGNVPEVIIGLRGRSKRDEDSSELAIIHVFVTHC